ncbi:hypothetical protein Lal_00011042, partial [Lupinus albus]
SYDPLSPILFYIAKDVLSIGITKLLDNKKISSISGPRSIQTPSHVLYVDDILIFCKGVKKELISLKELNRDYAKASGQTINPDQCIFYTWKISSLASLLSFSVDQLPFTYLGVPLFVGKPKKVHLQPLTDRILNKMTIWMGSILSIMGEWSFFHIYHWSVSLLNQFGDIDKKKLVTVACSKVCSFMQSGRLGLRSMKMLNKEVLLKLAWDLRSSNQDWAKFYITICYPTRYFKSSIWSGIRDNWSLVNMNSTWLASDGLQNNFWKDNWLGDPLIDILDIPQETHDSMRAKVVDFIIDSKWIIPSYIASLFPQIMQTMASTKRANGVDRIMWHNTSDKTLSMNRIEDSNHFFFNCRFAQELRNWLRHVLSYNLNSVSLNSLMLPCIKQQNSQVNDVMVAEIMHTISTIWFCKNQTKFEDKTIHLCQAVAKIKREDLLILKAFNVTGLQLRFTASFSPKRLQLLEREFVDKFASFGVVNRRLIIGIGLVFLFIDILLITPKEESLSAQSRLDKCCLGRNLQIACASILELALERAPLAQARNPQIAWTSIREVSFEPYSLAHARNHREFGQQS